MSGNFDATVRLWDVATGAQVGDPMTGHTGGVWAVAFSSDGNMIASGGSFLAEGRTESVRLWPAPPQPTWPELLCGKLTTNMSREQWRDWVSPDIDYMPQCPGLPIPD